MPVAHAERQPQVMSFASLRTRLLTMIARGDVPVNEIDGLRAELDKALARHKLPDPVPNEQAATAKTVTRYDDSLFGSQQKLLQHLRANRGSSLAELLALDQDD